MKKSLKTKMTLFAALCCFSGVYATSKAKVSVPAPIKAEIYVTAKDTALRLTQVTDVLFGKNTQFIDRQVSILVDPTHKFQTMLGIGGALTDASAEVYAKLPAAKQKEFMEAYYSQQKGIGYSLARTNIASCDFSSDIYNYVTENDPLLKSFNLSHDEKYRIPFIKQAIAAAGGRLTLFASPWSPPAWMKSNNDVLHGGTLLTRFKQSWANYFVKFIKGYEAAGIPVWGVTVQNEPMALQRWESCIYTSEEERDFIKYYLGPTLKKNGMTNKKIVAWDHNRDLIYHRASVILNDPEAAKYVWGIGYHWYETWTGSTMQFENVKRVREAYPSTNLLFTEGCVEKFSFNKLNDWSLGERYGMSMLNDFNDGAVGWTDWNVLLDETGGPNHVGNLCFAPIHANTKTGELIYTNSYYYLGHFSKFVRPEAKRIMSSSSWDKLQSTAFLNPNGKVIVIVLNLSDNKVPYKLLLRGKAIELESLAHSIMTIVI